jgi:hypothetical protein
MGVNADTFTLEKINHIKDLEIARHNLNYKSQQLQNASMDNQPVEACQVLFLGFGEEGDDGEDFTPVISRKSKKELKYVNKIQRSMERIRYNTRSLGAQSGFGAAQGKATNDHPVCGMVAGSRARKKNPKYL